MQKLICTYPNPPNPDLVDLFTVDKDLSKYVYDMDLFFNDIFPILNTCLTNHFQVSLYSGYVSFISEFKIDGHWFQCLAKPCEINDIIRKENQSLRIADYIKMTNKDFFNVMCDLLIENGSWVELLRSPVTAYGK